MDNVTNNPTGKAKTAPVEQPQEANHSERIKSQVLAKIGRPPRLYRVEVSRHHGGKYRVNIWQRPESNCFSHSSPYNDLVGEREQLERSSARSCCNVVG